MATISATVTVIAESLSEYNDLLGRAQTQDTVSNLLGYEPNLTITFDLNTEA